jgi:hypothetical protein
MHIVQTEASSQIVKTGVVEYTRIAHFSHDVFPGTGLYRRETLDLKGDPRLDNLVNSLLDTIKNRGWRMPKNEKEICETTVQLIHDPKFFGSYGINISNTPQELEQHDKMRFLKDFKTGELICKQEAAVASYALHKAGVENDFCAGESADISGHIGGHAFVQTRSGNIVEVTDPICPYGRTINKKMVRDGNIAIVEFAAGCCNLYGGGNMDGLRAIGYTFSEHKAELLKDQIVKNASSEVEKLKKSMDSALEAAQKHLGPLKDIGGVQSQDGSAGSAANQINNLKRMMTREL